MIKYLTWVHKIWSFFKLTTKKCIDFKNKIKDYFQTTFKAFGRRHIISKVSLQKIPCKK